MKIAILGYGKMGKIIEQLAMANGDKVVLKINSSNLEELTPANIQKADVAIEFSEPNSAFQNISFCLKNNIPVVSGTTAWLSKMDEAKTLCKNENGTFLYASNFSLGVNIFFQLNQQLAKMMAAFPAYSISLEEIHHTQKKDAPSGTAISLANDIIEVHPTKENWVNHKSNSKQELEIFSKRKPDVPGTHLVTYESEIDTIELKHEAHSRIGFAKGALVAAQWVIGKKGYFEMKDIIASL